MFEDDSVWPSMPDLAHLRDQWRLSRLSPSLREMGRRSMSEFLKSSKGRYEKVLADIFGVSVTIDSLESRLVNNLEFSADEEFPDIDTNESYTGLSASRVGDRIFVTFWR